MAAHEGITTALIQLKQKFGERFSTHINVRETHSHTLSLDSSELPDGVVFVETTEEVEQVVEVCRTWKCPIIPFGVGTSLEGHVNAPRGGVSVDFSSMNNVLDVYSDDLMVRVQPGVTREALNEALRDTGLFFPIDPGANATLGGMASTNASGTNAVRYGTMKNTVVSVEAILADGTKFRTASRAKKTSAGYDLTALMVGSEGTLGIITELIIRLAPRPETIVAGYINFPDVKSACQAVIDGIQHAIPFARIELMDSLQVKCCNAYSQLNLPESPSLFLEFHGDKASVDNQCVLFGELASEYGGSPIVLASQAEERTKLWKARHNVYFANVAFRPGCKSLTTDACVPISRLAECVDETFNDSIESNLIAPIVGHVGDGNFHVTILIDPDDKNEISRGRDFTQRLSQRAIAMGGTCTGEHGIGQGKKSYLLEELGSAVDVMRSIKQALDPDQLFNPEKIF